MSQALGYGVHDDRTVVVDRLSRLLAERLRPAVHRVVAGLDVAAWHVPGEPVPPPVAVAEGAFEPFPLGGAWGPPWGTTWFHLTGAVPELPAGTRVEVVVDLGWTAASPGFQAEGLAYRPDGSVHKGLHPRNDWVPVDGSTVDLFVEAAANPTVLEDFRPTRLGDLATAGDVPLYRLVRADVTVRDETLAALVHDLEVLAQLRAELPASEPRGHQILRALSRAMDALDPADLAGTAGAARAELAGMLARPAHASAHRISAVGHAHIDTAWLWPQRETVRKVARTAANVTDLLDTHPDLVYAMSSAQQFAWLEEHRPEVFARVAEHVRAGRFVPVGGMWVESDTNLPGGEALARQFVHGKRYFLDRFGIETREAWLPDSFGYSAALPQIVRLSGTRWFLSQKISWNQTNRFPHHTFWWEGIDGTRIFTHFPPADTYNADFTGRELAHTVQNYRDKGGGTRSLLPFGFGDGGGGPTREMLERARRLHDLEGSPRVTIETPDDFFTAARAEYPDAPVWSGELYLELHRGTFTSQARTKAGNRRSEHMLRTAELAATAAAIRGGFDYPYERFDRLWKTVLLNQFHDILPGSSIAWVHREAEATYGRVLAELDEIVEEATAAVAGAGDTPWVLNAGPLPRSEIIGGRLVRVAANYLGPLVAASETPDPVRVSPRTLDNGLVRVTLDDDGLITSIADLVAGREVLAPGQRGNLLRLHADLPNEWDAWDVDRHYRHQYTELTAAESVTPVESGPLVGAIRVERAFGASRITQTIRVRAGSKRIDIETEVDWHETEKMLKAGFPLDVHADRTAAEIQFGHVFRPTHTNTSWEMARFEVYGHRWVHAGEHGYGVALINDATYGHDVTRDDDGATVVRLSLLRAPRSPDPHADQGTHRMTYAILPGATIADAVAEGYALNLPLKLHPAGAAAAVEPLVEVDGAVASAKPLVEVDGAVLEAVKLADDRSGDVILRVYEALGGRARARIRASFPIAGAEVVDLLERPLAAVDPVPDPDGAIPLEVRPFQVVTLRLRRETA